VKQKNNYKRISTYTAKSKLLPGTKQNQVFPLARHLLRSIAKKTKRRAYIRSAYFHKEKVFLTYFWTHLTQKSLREQIIRLKYLPCAIELIQKSRYNPVSISTHNHPQEILHRFFGKTHQNQIFYVQIKENKQGNRMGVRS
jgi:hypothetical protein